jgi:uncharacterized protein YjbJ (UPF0337 family)
MLGLVGEGIEEQKVRYI